MAIRQKENGKYLVDLRDEYGKRTEKTFKTLKDAKGFEATVLKNKYDLQLVASKLKDMRYPLSQALQDFLMMKSDLRPGSIKRYRNVVTQIQAFADAWGIHFVDGFTPDHATIFFGELVKEKKDPKGSTDRILKPKPKTVNFYLATARAFFNHEYLKGHIKRNPMLHIKNQRVERRKPDYFTPEELKKFFRQPMPEAYRNAFLAFLFTGMRFSELANLCWSDIDFRMKRIHIHSSPEFKTKTHNAERTIPMTDGLYELLNKIALNPLSEKYPFCTPHGKQLRERTLLTRCKTFAQRAGISSNAYIHKFRHTYATMLIQNGVSIQNIKELLGHHSVVQTEIYAHNSSEYLHADVARINGLLKE